jgi:hypothetical protein
MKTPRDQRQDRQNVAKNIPTKWIFYFWGAILIIVAIASLYALESEPTSIPSTASKNREDRPTRESFGPSAICLQACQGCNSRDYENRCVDRCKFDLKPFCD